MKIYTLKLSGTSYSEISTEIKFNLATSRFDGVELIHIIYDTSEQDAESSRLYNIVLKALRSLKTKKNIQFFATPRCFEEGKTEAEFLINKYPEHFADESSRSCFYIKL